MRTNIAMLAVLAGLGLSSLGAAAAETKSLSGTSGIPPSEGRVVIDCESKLFMTTVILAEPSPLPLSINNGEGGKDSGTHGREKDHEAPAAAAIPGVRTAQPTEP